MRILLTHKFHRYTGGADVFYLEVGRILEENGHDVAYFSTKSIENVKSDFEEYFIDAPDFKKGSVIAKTNAFLKIPYNTSAKKKIAKLVDDFKPDVIHAFGVITHISPSIFDVARKKKIPLVISLNDYKHICPNYKLFHHNKICEDCKGGKFINAVKNKCCHDSLTFSLASSIESYVHNWLNIYKKNIDLFLFASDFMAHKTEEFWGKNSFKWAKLVNPFKVSTTSQNLEKGKYGLYFGRLSEEKGVHLILEALKLAPEIPFKIIGDGPELSKLISLKNEYDLKNLEFLGSKWGKELDDYLNLAKYVVVPSVWHENFPYVILQSFNANVPVIGSNLGGIPELLSANRGLIFDINSYQSLLNSIKKMNDDGELRTNLTTNARKYLEENFNDTKFYNSIINNYKKILK